MNLRTTHPLDPLNETEIKAAIKILNENFNLMTNHRFVCIMTYEPSQQVLLNLEENAEIDRLAFICFLNLKTNQAFEAIINITAHQLVSLIDVGISKPPHGQPPIMIEDFNKCERIVKADQAWQEAIKNRGVSTDKIENIQVDLFSTGHFGEENEKGKRLVRAISYYRENIKDNGYARPIEGLIAIVDLNNEAVIKLIDDGKNTPIPKKIINYDSASYPQKREGLKPLYITQPEGPSFIVDGWNVKWQNWSFRIGFTPREGVVLHQVSYNDEGRVRPIIHRASVTEMLVPYGDPNISHFWKSAFDAGEYGLGTLAGSLDLGCDCKGNIHYFDVPSLDNEGNQFVKKHAICMHEEDAGTLWKHHSFRDGYNEVRRARELVISFFPTVGNYDYGFYWRLSQDGSLRLDVKLTGIVQTASVSPNTEYRWGNKLTADLGAPFHQHFFNVRLHMMVDGEKNSFSQSDFYPVFMNVNNHYGTAFRQTTCFFDREEEAVCDAKAKTQRTWKIFNAKCLNELGEPTAYKLEVPQTPLLFADKDSYIAKRGGFAQHNVWVTPYDPKEKYASGDYPNQNEGGNGLPSYIKQNRNIRNKSLVVWVTFGPTHAPRPEDFPVMPVSTASIHLTPFGFFSKNPAMDLSADVDEMSVKHNEQVSCCK